MGVAYFNGLFISELMCLLDSKRSRRLSLQVQSFFYFQSNVDFYDEIALLWVDWRVPYEA